MHRPAQSFTPDPSPAGQALAQWLSAHARGGRLAPVALDAWMAQWGADQHRVSLPPAVLKHPKAFQALLDRGFTPSQIALNRNSGSVREQALRLDVPEATHALLDAHGAPPVVEDQANKWAIWVVNEQLMDSLLHLDRALPAFIHRVLCEPPSLLSLFIGKQWQEAAEKLNKRKKGTVPPSSSRHQVACRMVAFAEARHASWSSFWPSLKNTGLTPAFEALLAEARAQHLGQQMDVVQADKDDQTAFTARRPRL